MPELFENIETDFLFLPSQQKNGTVYVQALFTIQGPFRIYPIESNHILIIAHNKRRPYYWSERKLH